MELSGHREAERRRSRRKSTGRGCYVDARIVDSRPAVPGCRRWTATHRESRRQSRQEEIADFTVVAHARGFRHIGVRHQHRRLLRRQVCSGPGHGQYVRRLARVPGGDHGGPQQGQVRVHNGRVRYAGRSLSVRGRFALVPETFLFLLRSTSDAIFDILHFVHSRFAGFLDVRPSRKRSEGGAETV